MSDTNEELTAFLTKTKSMVDELCQNAKDGLYLGCDWCTLNNSSVGTSACVKRTWDEKYKTIMENIKSSEKCNDGGQDMAKSQKEILLDRKKMILAMEYICRQINDETVLEGWLMCGVPDGEIPYGSFDLDIISDDDSMVNDKDNFRDIMDCFLRRMEGAKKSGGLWCGDVVTKAG